MPDGHSTNHRCHVSRYKISRLDKKLEKDLIATEEPLQIDLIQTGLTLSGLVQKGLVQKGLAQNGIAQKSLAQKSLVQNEPAQGYSQTTYSITLRTPGDDEILCYGLLFTEGVIEQASDVLSIATAEIPGKIDANRLLVKLSPSLELDLEDKLRRTPSYSGCGLCGKTSMKALALKNYRPQKEITAPVSIDLIFELRKQLAQQPLFNQSGGCHVAGIIYELKSEQTQGYSFDIDGTRFFEDVGRHNALDKLIGSQLQENNLSKPGIVVLSGRIGYELVQKIVMAGYSTLIALGAPTSLAIQAANQFGVTMIGFAKDDQYNLYTF